MKRTSPFLALALLAAIFALSRVYHSSAKETAVPSNASAPTRASAAEQRYVLQIRGPGRWADCEVTLIESEEPLELSAELSIDGELPSGAREVSRKFAWSAALGRIEPDAASPDNSKARWTPPTDSRVVEIAVEADISLQGPSGASETVRRRAAIKLLSPASSGRMKNGVIDGYDLGQYPVMPTDPSKRTSETSAWVYKNRDRYRLPAYFYRIDTADKPLRLSPHITLGHFVIDYPWDHTLGMPQHVAIDLNLVQKLEELIALMQQDGKFKVTGLTPIYGFRSPRFNRQTIEGTPDKNLKVWWSMHQYGRAMDFIIDEDGDLVMDDLNGDGKHDIYDAKEIMHYVNILDRKYREEKRLELVGGAGLYEFHDFAGRVQSPYVHVDTRGFLSENGQLVRWKEPQPELWPDGTPIRWSKI